MTNCRSGAVAGKDTSHYPVEMLSWNDAAEFCVLLSQKERLKPVYFRAGETVTLLAGTGYRLPTEAQWEIACRAGTATMWFTGDTEESLISSGWTEINSGRRPHAVGELNANPFGLYDMLGNVWEYCQDGMDLKYYEQFVKAPAVDPMGPSAATPTRVIRGGFCGVPALWCHSSFRDACPPTLRDGNLGVRVAMPVDTVRQTLQSSPSANAPQSTEGPRP